MKIIRDRISIAIASLLMFSSVCFTSCDNGDDIVNPSVESEYDAYSASVSNSMTSLYNTMGHGRRAMLDNDPVSYLLTLTRNEVSEWYSGIASSYGEEYFAKHYCEKKLNEAFTSCQTKDFRKFLVKYYASGVKDKNLFITSETKGMIARERQLYTLGAVYVDHIVRPIADAHGLPAASAQGLINSIADSAVEYVVFNGSATPTVDTYCTASAIFSALRTVNL